MNKFTALLRGINVSGQKQIKMAELKSLFEDLGFKDVETYIQSGNVIFSSKEKSIEKIEEKISSSLKKKFGFEAETIVVTSEEIESVLDKNPFLKRKTDFEKLYVTFLSEIPNEEYLIKLEASDYSPEQFIIVGKIIYLSLPNGYGRTKLNNNFFEKKLNVSATTRNLKTVKALHELIKLH